MKIVKADVGEDGVARLVARDDRLELETVIYACTDGDRWVYERRRHLAAALAAGTAGSVPTVGRHIRHSDWELTKDA